MRTAQELREWLLAKRQELLAKLRIEAKREESPRLSDLLTLTHDQELEYIMVDQRTHTLEQVERALKTLDEGTYGRCEVCEGMIHPARLQAQPFALRCTSCQEAWERAEGRQPAARGSEEDEQRAKEPER